MPSLKAGEVIASGGYGCVIGISDKEVGKVNFEDAMWTEHEGSTQDEFMRIQKAIKELDPTEKYFITTTKIVNLDLHKPSLTVQNVKECFKHWMNNRSRTERQLVRADGKFRSNSLQMYVQTRVNPTDFTTWNEHQWNHALDGMKLLHKHNICHNDIHGGNFGEKNGMPVYIDMDGAYWERPLSLSFSKSRGITLNNYENKYQDIRGFDRMVKEFNE
jgi:hypothetical protein